MRAGLAALAMLAPLLPMPAMADWMTYVVRNIATGERTGPGARASIEGERPELAIACLSGALAASFDTGVELPPGKTIAEMATGLSVAGDGEAYDAYPATADLHEDREGQQIRLRLDAAESANLVDYILGVETGIQVSYRVDGQELSFIAYSSNGATISLGSVLRECPAPAGASKTK